MGFFDTLKDFANDVKKINKMKGIDFVKSYLEREKYKDYLFGDLIEKLYEGSMVDGIDRYAVYIELMTKYYFYDPYICKLLKPGIDGMTKESEYNTTNIERRLIEDFKMKFSEYSKDDLIQLIEKYRQTAVDVYNYKESEYCFTYSFDEEKIVNHYACMAAIAVLGEKYNIEIEFEDLSDSNDNDIREKKNKERMEKIGMMALKTVVSVANKYVPDEWNDEE